MRKVKHAASAGLAGVAVVCLLLAGNGARAGAKALPAITLGNANATAGQVAAVPVSYAPAGAAVEPSTLVLKAAWDAAWITFTGVSASTTLTASGKAFDFEPNGKSVTVVIYGGINALPQADLVYLNFQVDAAAMAGTSTVVRNAAGTNASDAAGEAVPLSVANGGLTVTTGSKPHSADYDHNFSISLSELLRMVQIYNLGSFHCDASTEDGYAPGPGDQACTPHDTDYNPRNWAISLNELLRIIQFYNAPGGGYHAQTGTEDGYAPGPWVPAK